MTEATHVANYMLESILKDLAFLKENSFIPNQTYNDVVAILPTRISTENMDNSNSKPPLPTRKSTNSNNNNTIPIPQPREMSSPSFPKLPVRRSNNDWQQQQQPSPKQQQVVLTKSILHTEPEKVTAAPPPAYTQKPIESTSLATAEALYDYHGEDPATDLSFKQGDIIEVTEYVNDDWWKGSVDGKSGIFPQNHVKKIAPPIKAKRPWVPPTAAKPAFSTSSNTSSYSYNTPPPAQYIQPPQQNQPYSYPPPPTALYQAPPAQPPVQSYGQPSTVAVVGEQPPHEENKVGSMAKKFGNSRLGEAVVWGAGATLGSKAVNAIF